MIEQIHTDVVVWLRGLGFTTTDPGVDAKKQTSFVEVACDGVDGVEYSTVLKRHDVIITLTFRTKKGGDGYTLALRQLDVLVNGLTSSPYQVFGHLVATAIPVEETGDYHVFVVTAVIDYDAEKAVA